MLVALLAACSLSPTSSAPPEAPTALPTPRIDDMVWTSVVVSAPDETPARFSASSTTVIGWGPRDLPAGAFADRLCRGAGDAREVVVAELRAGRDPDAWWDVLSTTDCGGPSFCGWVEPLLREAPDTFAPLWASTLECQGPGLDALLVANGPSGLVFTAALRRSLPWHPRLATLAIELDPSLWPVWAAALSTFAEPEARATLEALRRQLPPEEAVPTSPLTDVAALARLGLDPRVLVERFPNHRDALAEGLSACLGDDRPDDVVGFRRCARALVAVDRARAAQVVPSVADPWGALQDVLLRDPEDVRRQLVELGLSDAGGPVDGATTVGEVLEAMGHALVFGWMPRGDEATQAYRLAALAGLQDVAFDQVMPSWEAASVDGRRPLPALFAWTGHHRLRTLLDGDWDLPRTLGLVNAVLERRGREERLALDHSRTTVVSATPRQLAAIADRGLLAWATWAALEEEP